MQHATQYHAPRQAVNRQAFKMKHFVKLMSVLALTAPSVGYAQGVDDLFTQTGTDRTWQQLLDDNAIPIGVNSTAGVSGSTIDVNNALIETGPFGNSPIMTSDVRLHTVGNSNISRNEFGKWSRWYQEDGNTQVFRLFEGETNVRNDRPFAARSEAFQSANEWQAGDGWNKWQGRFTIIKPQGASILQVFNSSNQWAMQIVTGQGGNVAINPRRGENIRLGTDMVGKPFDLEVYDDGTDYRVYYNGDFAGGGTWDRPNGDTRFRWGIYKGENPVTADSMLFITGAQVFSNVQLPGPPPPLGVLYQHDFDGPTSVGLNGQSATRGDRSWVAAPAFRADGRLTGARGSATLDFNPQNNITYQLDATVTNTDDTGWIGIGFADGQSDSSANNNRFTTAASQGTVLGKGWLIFRNEDGTRNTFVSGSDVNSGGDPEPWLGLTGDLGDTIDIRLILTDADPTLGIDWQVTYFAKLPDSDTYTQIRDGFESIPVGDIASVGFSVNDATGSLDAFTLTVVPQPGSLMTLAFAGLLIARRRRV